MKKTISNTYKKLLILLLALTVVLGTIHATLAEETENLSMATELSMTTEATEATEATESESSSDERGESWQPVSEGEAEINPEPSDTAEVESADESEPSGEPEPATEHTQETAESTEKESRSISGSIWNENEIPIADYPVFLYLADDLAAYNQILEEEQVDEQFPEPFQSTLTKSDGTYRFDDLEPGNYIVAISPYFVNDEEYMLPTAITDYNKFAADDLNESFMAYTEVISLNEAQSAENINAIFMLPINDNEIPLEEIKAPEQPVEEESEEIDDGEPPVEEEEAEAEDNEETVDEETEEDNEEDEEELGETEETGEEEADDEETEEIEEIEEIPEIVDISGFLWIDSNENGLYDDDEQPLPKYPVYIYAWDTLTIALGVTLTNSDGTYVFEDLEPASYVLGLASETVNGEKYLPPMEITGENKFAVDWESDPLTAYTEIIELGAGQDAENINAGLTPMPMMKMMAMAGNLYTIDLATVATVKNGPGWSHSVISSVDTVTFNNAAGGNEYNIVMSGTGTSQKNIVINSDVDNITVRYDGPNINGYKYNTTPPSWHPFTSNITINGGENNTVIFDRVVSLSNSTVEIKSGANNTAVIFDGVSHADTSSGLNGGLIASSFTINNNGANTTVIYDGVNIRHSTFNHNTGTATMYLRGTNNFTLSGTYAPYFNNKLAANTNLNLILSGSATASSGFFEVPETAVLTIESESGPGSENGSLSITCNRSSAVIGSPGVFNSIGNGGKIIINGGTLTLTQNGADGAVIGGGKNHTGDVTINGGKLTLTQNGAGGAAIGGGSGNSGTVTINGGTINAELKSGDGAVIGGGYGTNGVGYVTINGGTINAKCEYGGRGAGIGGGGNAPGYVTITNGNITASASNGAGIGNGAGTGLQSAGAVTIKNGVIKTHSAAGAGVGTGGGNGTPNVMPNVKPKLNICHNADILAFSKGQFNPLGGIHGDGANLGDAHFVTLHIYYKFAPTTDKLMIVYADGDRTAPLRVATIPYAFTMFSYTTGTTASRNDNIFVGDYSGGMTQLVRKCTHPTICGGAYNPVIHSVNGMGGYMTDEGATNVDYQWVMYGEGAGYSVHFEVEENHVDMSGNTIASFTKVIAVGTAYNGTPLTPPDISGDYTYKGYKWTQWTPSDALQQGNPSIPSVTAPAKVYFVYSESVDVDVTISKQTDGPFADKTKSFAFKVYIPDKVGVTVNCVGSGAPPGGALTFDAYGEATFNLKHGQEITLKNIPSNVKIQVTEMTDGNYDVSFKDSLEPNPIKRHYTDLTYVGNNNRSFDFLNTRKTIVPTGVVGEFWNMKIWMLIAAFILLTEFIAMELFQKRIRAKKLKHD